jgi:hypothetical protein
MRGSKPGERRGGRQKGTPNKVTALLKEEILEAAEKAMPGGRVAYLTWLATNHAPAFASLLGKILPTQIEGPAEDGAQVVEFRWLPPGMPT